MAEATTMSEKGKSAADAFEKVASGKEKGDLNNVYKEIRESLADESFKAGMNERLKNNDVSVPGLDGFQIVGVDDENDLVLAKGSQRVQFDASGNRSEQWGADANDREFVMNADGTATHTVKKGESLWKIAADICREKNNGAEPNGAQVQAEANRLYAANKEKIGNNPNLIQPGLELTIPAESVKEVQAAQQKADAKPPEGPQPDGKAPQPDGKAPQPDGKAPQPDGKAPQPDGKAPQPDGKAPQPDGKAPQPDGTPRSPKGPMDEGRSPDKDGKAPAPARAPQKPDSEAPDGKAPRTPGATDTPAPPAAKPPEAPSPARVPAQESLLHAGTVKVGSQGLRPDNGIYNPVCPPGLDQNEMNPISSEQGGLDPQGNWDGDNYDIESRKVTTRRDPDGTTMTFYQGQLDQGVIWDGDSSNFRAAVQTDKDGNLIASSVEYDGKPTIYMNRGGDNYVMLTGVSKVVTHYDKETGLYKTVVSYGEGKTAEFESYRDGRANRLVPANPAAK